jgi:hypothetical protein
MLRPTEDPVAGSPSGGKQYICIYWYNIRDDASHRSSPLQERSGGKTLEAEEGLEGGGNEQLGHDDGEGKQLEHQPWQPAMASMKTSYSLLFARVDLGFDESSLVGEWCVETGRLDEIRTFTGPQLGETGGKGDGKKRGQHSTRHSQV